MGESNQSYWQGWGTGGYGVKRLCLNLARVILVFRYKCFLLDESLDAVFPLVVIFQSPGLGLRYRNFREGNHY